VGPAVEGVTVLPPAAELRHELHHLQASWWWLLLLGVLLVVCGSISIIFPFLTSVAAITVLAAVLMVAGVATIIGAFWAGRWSGVLVQVLVGILYLAAGFVVSERPLTSMVVITFFMAVSFIVMGAFRTLAALMIRFPQWGWALLNGVITLLAGIIIFRQLPLDALWVTGLLVGLEMLFNGWTWIMLAGAIYRLPKATL
jgi:uncharacterized membrane protein HdeD (DUF308 family)